ncbi:hypothetical protein [Streptomyces hokutonensis]|uniref:Uncharacterized protein n=1 Tax=Streptomyces hokutonensis TaxID=1306990 RepID=A0ABW6MEI0_9ACTN
MPSTGMSERAARAALAVHFSPDQVAAQLAQHSAEDVWQYGGDHDAAVSPSTGHARNSPTPS